MEGAGTVEVILYYETAADGQSATVPSGAVLVADGAADIAVRLIPGAELPVSVLTTALGVPMLVSLMVKGGRADA